MPLSNLRTTAEAARRLRCTPRYIAQLVKRKKLEAAAKLPGRTGAYLFRDSELDRFEAARDGAAATPAACAACASQGVDNAHAGGPAA